jgi:hypothetical protein
LWKTIEGIVIRFGVGPAIMTIASVAVGIRGNSLRFVITQVQGITYSLPVLLINILSRVSLSTMPLIYLQHLWLRLESLCIHVLVTSNLKQMQQKPQQFTGNSLNSVIFQIHQVGFPESMKWISSMTRKKSDTTRHSNLNFLISLWRENSIVKQVFKVRSYLSLVEVQFGCPSWFDFA